MYKEKEQFKKEKEEFDKLKKSNFELKEVKKPRKKYTLKPKEELQSISESSDTSSSEDYIVEKQKPKRKK